LSEKVLGLLVEWRKSEGNLRRQKLLDAAIILASKPVVSLEWLEKYCVNRKVYFLDARRFVEMHPLLSAAKKEAGK
jgi:uncharacterized cysteine cluster protein YcgN (CxxCxxCC family)